MKREMNVVPCPPIAMQATPPLNTHTHRGMRATRENATLLVSPDAAAAAEAALGRLLRSDKRAKPFEDLCDKNKAEYVRKNVNPVTGAIKQATGITAMEGWKGSDLWCPVQPGHAGVSPDFAAGRSTPQLVDAFS